MKKIQIISENKNYTAADLGNFADIGEYSTMHPKLHIEVPGKVFISDVLKTTGIEASFQIMPPKSEIPFLHQHNENEELYLFLKGEGEFEVDGERFPIKEGSLIRVAPQGKRTWRNNSEETLILMVIQVNEGSLEHFGISDGFRI